MSSELPAKELEGHVLSVLGEDTVEPGDLLRKLRKRSNCTDEEARNAIWGMLGRTLLELDKDWNIKAIPPDQLKPA
jgi:hypothetical protein